MKKLSIIIPVYNDSEDYLMQALSSINNQIDVDFSEIDIHLVNDAGMPILIEKFQLLKNLNLYLHQLPVNVGQGAARQYGIDHSQGEYLMFMDQDDSLYSAGSLAQLLQGVGHQLVSGKFLFKPNSEHDDKYQVSDNENFFLSHGKLFSRKFLTDIGLRFHPDLRYFEDHYFVGLAKLMADDIYRLDEKVYVWRWNKDSSSRKKGGRDEMLLWLPFEGRYFLEFLKANKADILKVEFDIFLANCFYAFSDQKPEGLEKLEAFRNALKSLLCEFPEELSSQNFRTVEMQGNLFNLLHSEEYKSFLAWALSA